MTQHPSEVIDPGLVRIIRDTAPEAEQLKQLHPAQLEIIYAQNWFNLFVPQSLKGLSLSLPQALRLEEAIAWADGSMGWTITLCAGAGWFCGFLAPGLSEKIFSEPKACLAGTGKSAGIATIVEDGYKVTGFWNYATGSRNATAFTANCLVVENGIQLNAADGSPLILSFLFLKEEVSIHNTQQFMGMLATGSNSFSVNALKVPRDRAFTIDPAHAVLKDVLYQYPFLQFAETTLAVNSSGMAMRFLELCQPAFGKKSSSVLRSLYSDSVDQLYAARDSFFRLVQNSWTTEKSDAAELSDLLKHLSSVSKKLAYVSRKIVDELYPYCGMHAANPQTEINRVWRNLHTASQHSLFHG